MKKNVLIKAACMVAVLGAMVLWSCSQDEEIEEQMEWSKKAVKKSLARSGPSHNESYYFVTFFQFYPSDSGVKQVDASYYVSLTIESDTSWVIPTYTYKSSFEKILFNPPLFNEQVSVSGMEYNGYHTVTFTISADCRFNQDIYTDKKTFTTVIPPWLF